MLKKVMGLAILSCGLGLAVNASAAEHTVSLGYAQMKAKGGDSDDLKPKGVNAQYRFETESPVGVIASMTYASDKSSSTEENYKESSKGRYFSLLAGPAYRFNEYVSVYGLLGFANTKVDYNESEPGYSYSSETTDTSFAYGAGVAINPVQNVAVNIGYEGATLKAKGDYDRTKLNGFNLSVGYKF